MKKTIILSAALLIVCFFTACEAQPTSSDGSAVEAYVTDTAGTTSTAAVESSIATESFETDQLSPKSNNSSGDNISQTSSVVTTGCTHDYTIKVVAPTCTEKGYTLHTCKKCGESYRDSYVSPRHEYGKYLCDICGLPNPDDPIHSLSAWIKTNGTLADNGKFSYIEYEQSGITYSIFCDPYNLNIISFEFKGDNDEYFQISVMDTNECNLYYSNNGIQGRAEMKSFAVCSSTPLKLTYFYNESETVCSQEEFAAQMTSKIDNLMEIIQDKMLYPKTSLKLKNFGFTAY